MGLISGPNKADDTCGKTTVTGTMERDSTVFKRNWEKSINTESTIQYMLPGLKSEVLVTLTCYAS